MQNVTVRVPASTSNLGPGFDCLGLALRIYNDVTLTRGGSRKTGPMVRRAAEMFFDCAGLKPFRFSCRVDGEVPISRGLGSSVTVRLGTMIGLNELTGRPVRREDLFALCSALEGHPDNAAPATFGGFNIMGAGGRQMFSVSPKLKIVLLIPPLEVATDEARRLLPRTIPHRDAARNVGAACGIAAAFAARRYHHLEGAFKDYLHEPFRAKLVPFFHDAVAAAEEAGALGAFLSGSGSTIAALTLTSPQKIASAMLKAANSANARTIITSADNRGARIVLA
jgi:homoserine kinase